MRKRIFLVLLAALLVLTSCGSVGDDTPDPTDAPDTSDAAVREPLDPDAVLEVCEAWGNYLEAAQIKSYSEEWGIGYVKAYCENPSALALQRAISASEAVVATLRSIKLPESGLSAEALSSLADGGADMSFVAIEYDNLKKAIDESINEWDGILRSIITDSFWEYGIEYVGGWADVQLEETTVYNSYYGMMTDAILLSLGETRESSAWELWQEKAPYLLGEAFSWTDNEDQLSLEISRLLDRLEDLTVESSKLNGILSANIAVLDKAFSTGDWSEVNAVAVDFADHFLPIPLPVWSASYVYSYKFDEAANDAVWTAVGYDLTVCPDGFIFRYDGITREDFYSYVDYLSTLGVKYYDEGSTTEGDSISLYYLEYCTMSLKWEGNMASIYFYDNEPLLVPSWYLGYLLMSLN